MPHKHISLNILLIFISFKTQKLNFMKEQLSNVLKARDDRKGVKTDFSVGLTHTERRLHQMMFADRDYEGSSTSYVDRPHISIENCLEKGYSVVTICCKDRSKLLFDTVCTLTDMQYVVFHATIDSDGPNAVQVMLLNNTFFTYSPSWSLPTIGRDLISFVIISTNRNIISVIWMGAHWILKARNRGSSSALKQQ